ncbi:MAG: hypothetical protein DI533_22715 [Cereibacter sphaeroides]|uniref:Uncharacterized protein n=1 Tax=Cereibacter sphaeroides TaxID=1063 RepID=A0A2W5RZ89_CERSP|nr:MAG: hypothetical protein DI533_22715 [Cereibacter sphaeroides]
MSAKAIWGIAPFNAYPHRPLLIGNECISHRLLLTRIQFGLLRWNSFGDFVGGFLPGHQFGLSNLAVTRIGGDSTVTARRVAMALVTVCHSRGRDE